MQKTLNSTSQSRAARSDIKRNMIVSSSSNGRFRIAKQGQLLILMSQVLPVWSLSSTKINEAIARKRRTCSNFWCQMVLSRTLLRRLILRRWVLRIRRRIRNNAYHSAVLSNPMTCEFAIISEIEILSDVHRFIWQRAITLFVRSKSNHTALIKMY